MSDFGKRLKVIRKKQKITQKQLATALNLTQSTIANYENDIRFPGEHLLRQLSDFLNVSADYLLGIQPSLDLAENSNDHALHILSDTELVDLHLKLLELLIMGDETTATDMLMDAFKQGKQTLEFIECVFIPILTATGLLWQKGEISIATEHFISNLIDRWLTMISPSTLTETPFAQKPYSAVFIVPSGEEHVLILKMIKTYFRLHHWKTYYLGNSIPLSSLKHFIESYEINLVVLSISIKSHLNSAEDLIQSLKSQNTKNSLKILIGGSAIDDAAHAKKRLKADYYGSNISALDALIKQIEEHLEEQPFEAH